MSFDKTELEIQKQRFHYLQGEFLTMDLSPLTLCIHAFAHPQADTPVPCLTTVPSLNLDHGSHYISLSSSFFSPSDPPPSPLCPFSVRKSENPEVFIGFMLSDHVSSINLFTRLSTSVIEIYIKQQVRARHPCLSVQCGWKLN